MNPITEPVKITSLELENVKRIRACAITPTQNGLTVIGGMIASMVSIKIALVANFGADVTLNIQGIFDEICPCILPLGVTFLIYRLLKKGVKAWWIMIGIIVVGIVGKFFGIL